MVKDYSIRARVHQSVRLTEGMEDFSGEADKTTGTVDTQSEIFVKR